MNKQFAMALLAVTALVGQTAWAEGYQVNSLSARQNGMGHTGTALKLGAESQFFNPAGLAFMDGTIDVSGTLTGIFSYAQATHNGVKYETDSDPATPIGLHLGMRVYDTLKVGVSFYTPYGSSINWTDNWPGAELNQSVQLKVFTIQPTVAYKILPNLSIGAGLSILWGNVNLNKGLLSPVTMDAMLEAQGLPYRYGNSTPASVNLLGDATPRLGVNLGVMWDINPQWTVGFNYRSRVNMRVKSGTATVNTTQLTDQLMANVPQLQALALIDRANFSAEMPACAVYRMGVSYKPIEKLTLAFDAQLTGWSAYKQLDIEFAGDLASNFDQHISKDYKNSWLFMLGAQYALTERFDVRAGMMVDTTPVRKDRYNPETPGMTKIEPSVGLSFRPIPNVSIDASFLYVAGMGVDNAQCTYTDMITQQPTTFTADYTLHALCPAVGVTLNF